MHIEHTSTPTAQDIDFLTQKINQESVPFGSAFPFGFFIRNEEGDILAGCNGSVVFGAIYTDQLWVDPSHRKQGLGRALMERVHAYGRSLGCPIATVATMDFQHAQTFYESLGYESDFQRPGYTQGAKLLFFKKTL